MVLRNYLLVINTVSFVLQINSPKTNLSLPLHTDKSVPSKIYLKKRRLKKSYDTVFKACTYCTQVLLSRVQI